MRLAEQVVVVDGAKRSAIYDLASNRVRRLPKTVADGLRQKSMETAIPSQWLTHLLESHFLVDDSAKGVLEAYSPTFSHPRMPFIHTLTLDFAASRLARLSPWLMAARAYFELAHMIILAEARDEIAGTRFLRACLGDKLAASCELIIKDGHRLYSGKIFDSDMRPRIWRTFEAASPNMTDFIRATTETYSLLQRQSELSGHLHVDGGGVVRPHWDEPEVVLGTIDVPLQAIIRSDPFGDVQNNRKDARDQCRDCEIRYACMNPFCYRVSPAMTSAPSNCAYDPLSSDPQNSMFWLAI